MRVGPEDKITFFKKIKFKKKKLHLYFESNKEMNFTDPCIKKMLDNTESMLFKSP